MEFALLAWRYRCEIIIFVLVFALSSAVTSCYSKAARIEHLHTEHELELTTIRATHIEAQRDLELQHYEQIITAINEHKARQTADASAIASASAANERLSQTIDRLAANAATDATYRIEYATTTGELLKECSGSITRLAAVADGHVNDIRLLQDARRGLQ